jgi:acyl-CoA synthetase (AMP-forming)/AMP-acid ligase II
MMMAAASPELACADTRKDDAAFWLYSSGTNGTYKGTIHLHHDMIVEADLYARNTIGLREDDVSFSVAKLFFAYGLGNGLYFPLATAAPVAPDRPCRKAHGSSTVPAHGLLRRAHELRPPFTLRKRRTSWARAHAHSAAKRCGRSLR